MPAPVGRLSPEAELLSGLSVSANLPFVVTYAMDPWAVLGDPTRRTIVERLTARPSSVSELAEELPVSRPAVSQHLKLLKLVGLVRDRTEGTRRIYEVDAERLEQFRRELDTFWGATLQNLGDLAATQESEVGYRPARANRKGIANDD